MIKKTKQQNGELIFGVHPILEALKLKRRKLISIYTTKPTPKSWPQIEQLLPKYPINIQYVAREILHKMAGTTDHQNILAWVQPFPYRKKFFEPTKEKFLLMLDGIQDPRNLGAIIRSAYCTGVDGVIIIQQSAAPLTASAIKSSAGLAERMDIFIASSAVQAAKELEKAGYTLYLATFDGENAATKTYTYPLCLVIGSEGEGISRDMMQRGIHVTIPQRTKDISYNASVAAGILLFLLSKK